MKNLIITLFCVMLLSITVYSAGTLTVMPTTWQTLEFADVNPGNSSGIQIALFTTADGTIPWNINMKYDYFTLDHSTITLPYYTADYTILKTPCDDAITRPLPWNWATIYTSKTSEFSTRGTTVTVHINLAPDKNIKTGIYRSNLHIELGNYIP